MAREAAEEGKAVIDASGCNGQRCGVLKTNSHPQTSRGAQAFLDKHQPHVTGIISGFDRVRLQGTLRIFYREQTMDNYLRNLGVLHKDFKAHLCGITQCVREAASLVAKAALTQVRYLCSSALNKERYVAQLLRDNPVREGLITVLSAVEPCRTWFMRGSREDKKLHFTLGQGKCLHYYFYLIDPLFGLMHMRLQTWFPFLVHFCINGREWLSRQLDAEGIGYKRADNCFTSIADLPRAQQLMDAQTRTNFQTPLDALIRQYHPTHQRIRQSMPVDYYYSAAQSEHATDILFKDRNALGKIYPHLVLGSMATLGSEQVLRFLGRKSAGKTEVQTDSRRREEGVRIKHWNGQNSIKLYDKGSVLRSEVTINDPGAFKVYRQAEGDKRGKKSWRKLRRGLADMPRRAQVSRAASERHLGALAQFECEETLLELLAPLCKPVRSKAGKSRGLRPFEALEMEALRALGNADYCLHGLRHRDLREALRAHMPAGLGARSRAARVARVIRLLRAHKLLRKVGRTHRYQVTPKARKVIPALLGASRATARRLITLVT